MKIYKEITHVSLGTNSDKNGNKFFNEVRNSISKMQDKGLEVEIQYSTTATLNEYINSALILGYICVEE